MRINIRHLTREQTALVTEHAKTLQPRGFWVRFCRLHGLSISQVTHVRKKCGLPMRPNKRRAA